MEHNIEKPEYPRLPYNANRNRKILDWEDADIKKQYAEGKTITYLAKKYKVYWTTIKAHVDENYRINKVKKEIEAHKRWYATLDKKEKQRIWHEQGQRFKENRKRFRPQNEYAAFFTSQNHKKPDIYKKRMKRQKEYAHQPKIKNRILERQRQAYQTMPERKKYHKDYNKDYRATHKLINEKWILTDPLKWRIRREMVIH